MWICARLRDLFPEIPEFLHRRLAVAWAAATFLCVLSAQPARAQLPPGLPIDVIPKPTASVGDQVQTRNGADRAAMPQKTVQKKDDTCLLSPLNLVTIAVVTANRLQVPAKAKKEYQAGCAALKEKKIDDAEKHLRKAVQEYPKYAVAWVTLGQMLEARQQGDEARAACAQGSDAEPGFVPAHLCLADIALRAHAWEEVLKHSGRAIEIDPGGNALAYEYNAAAELKVHKLDEAEKSGLRAAEIDQNHKEPRVHFVLAQVYEAKGDAAKEAAQLQEYLKYATDEQDIAMVKQVLAALESRTAK